MSTLRLATLNIWNKSGPWPERLALIRREFERLNPAVLGLQEVLRFAPSGLEKFVPTPAACQATEIAQGFDYTVAYAIASDYGHGLKFGNAVLSQFPILEQRTFVQPGSESGESRSLLYARLDTTHQLAPDVITYLAVTRKHDDDIVRAAVYLRSVGA